MASELRGLVLRFSVEAVVMASVSSPAVVGFTSFMASLQLCFCFASGVKYVYLFLPPLFFAASLHLSVALSIKWSESVWISGADHVLVMQFFHLPGITSKYIIGITFRRSCMVP